MSELIELSLNTPDGIADCQLELQENGDYSVTILYPEMVNGFSRPKVYCHELHYDDDTKTWWLADEEPGIHPKVKKLEKQIQEAVAGLQ